MTRFVGNHDGKLDAKGRLSIPALFRGELESTLSDQIILKASHVLPCIECFGRAAYDQILDSIQQMDMYSEDRQDLEAAFISDCVMLRYDGEGRLVPPAELMAELGVKPGDKLIFLGKGKRFEIWEEARGRAHLAEAKARVSEKRQTLSSIPLNTNPRAVP